MRLWSLHPSYLDSKGIVALWRESLLAKKVLEGKTKGYRHHPQLIRFQNTENPLFAINYYLWQIYEEAFNRGYSFDKNKIDSNFVLVSIPVTTEQIKFEFEHLLGKLKIRDENKYNEIKDENSIRINSIFTVIKGEIESWEIRK
jgi:hypothetical protein